MPTQDDHPVTSSSATRRWTVIASGLLVLALALVVIYTRPSAFLSPIALVVVSAIGLAALLLQLRFRRDLPEIRSPLWLNILGVLLAGGSLMGDHLHLRAPCWMPWHSAPWDASESAARSFSTRSGGKLLGIPRIPPSESPSCFLCPLW